MSRLIALCCALFALPAGSVATARAETVTLTAVQDTTVDSTRPARALGDSTVLRASARPRRYALLRFDTSSLAGRRVLSARLRLVAAASSSEGGRIRGASANWGEATTWRRRPGFTGDAIGRLGRPRKGRATTVGVTSLVTGPQVDLAIVGTGSADARWSSNDSRSAPKLVVEVDDVVPAPEPATVATPVAQPSPVGAEPTPTPTATPSPAPEPEPTASPTATAEPTASPTATAEPTASPTATAEPTASPTATAEPTASPTATAEPTASPTATAEPTATATATPTVLDGRTEVAATTVGNSDPTFYTSQHRQALTAGGRLLTVHGAHTDGVRLAWRDADSTTWSHASRGASTSGALLSGADAAGTGDWPASMVVADDGDGVEHAWIVIAGSSPTTVGDRPLYLVRVSELDAATGPVISARASLDPGLHAATPDIAEEDGEIAILWTRPSGAAGSVNEIRSAWLSSTDTDSPTITDEHQLLLASGGAAPMGTFAPSATGLRAVVRDAAASPAKILLHDPLAPNNQWTTGGTGYAATRPCAVAAGGSTWVAGTTTNYVVGSGATPVVNVQRFGIAGAAPTSVTQFTGYREACVVSDGSSVWLVMTRHTDSKIVSKSYDAILGTWSSDVVEASAVTDTGVLWPNVIREVDAQAELDGHPRLRIVVRGDQGTSAQRSGVQAVQRRLD